MVFILYRSPDLAGSKFDVYASGEKIELGKTYEETEWGGEKFVFLPSCPNQENKPTKGLKRAFPLSGPIVDLYGPVPLPRKDRLLPLAREFSPL